MAFFLYGNLYRKIAISYHLVDMIVLLLYEGNGREDFMSEGRGSGPYKGRIFSWNSDTSCRVMRVHQEERGDFVSGGEGMRCIKGNLHILRGHKTGILHFHVWR